jgi:hypothetical protein
VLLLIVITYFSVPKHAASVAQYGATFLSSNTQPQRIELYKALCITLIIFPSIIFKRCNSVVKQ